jgi:hypothetical protein
MISAHAVGRFRTLKDTVRFETEVFSSWGISASETPVIPRGENMLGTTFALVPTRKSGIH